MNSFMLCIAFVVVAFIGNYIGDQATLRDCATNGKAKMVGGGTVVCHVEKNVVPTNSL